MDSQQPNSPPQSHQSAQEASPTLSSTQNPALSVIDATNKKDLKAAVDDFIAENGLYAKEEHVLKKIQVILKNEDGHNTEQVVKEVTTEIEKYSKLNAVENGLRVQASVHPEDRELVKGMRDALIHEHNASTVAEKSAIDLAVNGYFRSLRNSHVYSMLLDNNLDWVSDPKNNLLKEVGKGISIANQQYFTSMTFLKGLRQPSLNIKVHNGSAFIAQNQQFNKNA